MSKLEFNRMKNIIGAFIGTLMVMSFGLAQSSTDMHINSIRYAPNKADSSFIEHVIQSLLDRPQDVVFLSNRDLLTSLCVSHCSDEELTIHDTLKNGKIIHMYLRTKAFNPTEHAFSYYPGEDSLIETIDGLPAYGGTYQMPQFSIDSLSVVINGKDLKIPEDAYADLYNPNLCESEFFRQPVAAYPAEEGDYFFLYLYGGSSSDTYFTKLIFNKKRFLKKIIAEYPDLIDHGALREDFIGF